MSQTKSTSISTPTSTSAIVEDKFKNTFALLERMGKVESTYSSLTKLFQKQANLLEALTEVGNQITSQVTRLSSFYPADLGDLIRDLSNHCCKVDNKLTSWSKSITNDCVEPLVLSVEMHEREIQSKFKIAKTSQQTLQKDLSKAEKKLAKISKVRHPETNEMKELEVKKEEIEKKKTDILEDVQNFERNRFKFFLSSFLKPIKIQSSLGKYIEKMGKDFAWWNRYAQKTDNKPFSILPVNKPEEAQEKTQPTAPRAKVLKSLSCQNVTQRVTRASKVVNDTKTEDRDFSCSISMNEMPTKPEMPKVPAPSTLPPPLCPSVISSTKVLAAPPIIIEQIPRISLPPQTIAESPLPEKPTILFVPPPSDVPPPPALFEISRSASFTKAQPEKNIRRAKSDFLSKPSTTENAKPKISARESTKRASSKEIKPINRSPLKPRN